jgi:hypothetical protein
MCPCFAIRYARSVDADRKLRLKFGSAPTRQEALSALQLKDKLREALSVTVST